MPKSYLKKNSRAIYPKGLGGFILFPSGVSLKVNVIARVEFELTYFKATV